VIASFEVDARLAAVQALEEAGAGELDQVAQALAVLRQQREVVALDLALADRAIVDEIRLEADDRLDAVLAGGLVELDRAVHHAVVREAQRGLPELRGALGELVDVACPVEQRVLGVDVEVGAAGSGHGQRRLGGASDGAAPASPHDAGNRAARPDVRIVTLAMSVPEHPPAPPWPFGQA
jgi:hypothetical protein